MNEPARSTSRAERRRGTEERILGAARDLFARHGYERATIRAVAAAAGVDPALVMQYFGSKAALFARAAEVRVPEGGAGLGEGPDGAVTALLASLGVKLDGLPATSLATLRSMLTHPDAAEHARTTLGRQIDEIAAGLPATPDARARAALAVTTVVGATIGHQLLGLPDLRDTAVEHLTDLLRPALHALLEPAEPPKGEDLS
ncbi:TetR/AcrR family transcriptional regulator [Streptomyces sp. RFCAC02]|uniref:TetR/AcrR family transcriptional regulator n=1 Tax=Streptomyces sp. RFCAC02 TaxID=2499143 RepID=UPI00101F26F9|nr:TetR/AcrR family transcriptional regulator [Streptomyces sp. RFCAC02]